MQHKAALHKKAFEEKFGKEEVAPILEKTIMDLSRIQGAELSKKYGNGVESFLETLKRLSQLPKSLHSISTGKTATFFDFFQQSIVN